MSAVVSGPLLRSIPAQYQNEEAEGAFNRNESSQRRESALERSQVHLFSFIHAENLWQIAQKWQKRRNLFSVLIPWHKSCMSEDLPQTAEKQNQAAKKVLSGLYLKTITAKKRIFVQTKNAICATSTTWRLLKSYELRRMKSLQANSTLCCLTCIASLMNESVCSMKKRWLGLDLANIQSLTSRDIGSRA